MPCNLRIYYACSPSSPYLFISFHRDKHFLSILFADVSQLLENILVHNSYSINRDWMNKYTWVCIVLGKYPDTGKNWRPKKKMAEDENARKHHWLGGHESEQIPGDSGGQMSLACCSPWGCKESGTATQQQPQCLAYIAQNTVITCRFSLGSSRFN